MSERTEKVIAGQGPLVESARVLCMIIRRRALAPSLLRTTIIDDQKGQTERPAEKIAFRIQMARYGG
jgi:hypothetical protein